MAERSNGAAGPATDLERRLQYTFTDRSLLTEALSHRSWCAEHGGARSNERLEFLGDAVLGWVVADVVFRGHPTLTEGQLSDLRKAVVNASALAELATALGLGDDVRLGVGEARGGGRAKRNILADAFEAVLGAVYLDGGVHAVRPLIERLLTAPIAAGLAALGRIDFKTALQEEALRRLGTAPRYEIDESGPDHAKSFVATVWVGNRNFGTGAGQSKKEAQQAAAAVALAELDGDA